MGLVDGMEKMGRDRVGWNGEPRLSAACAGVAFSGGGLYLLLVSIRHRGAIGGWLRTKSRTLIK